MKKVGIISVLLSISALAGNDINEGSVPQNISQKFHTQFPEVANVTWHMVNDQYEAVGQQGEKEVDVYYDEKARCIEVDREITADQLPADFQAQIKSEFGADCHIVNVMIIDKKDTKPIYTVRVKQGKLAYDMEFADTNKVDLAFHKKIIS